MSGRRSIADAENFMREGPLGGLPGAELIGDEVHRGRFHVHAAHVVGNGRITGVRRSSRSDARARQ